MTAILYLNGSWQEGDGGVLRLYHTGGAGGERRVDVPPRRGSLVLFWSHRIAHEVRHTHKMARHAHGALGTRMEMGMGMGMGMGMNYGSN